MKRVFLLTVAALITTAVNAAAQQPMFVVRHAERADGGAGAMTTGTDPELSDAGRARAQSLAATLKDAGITTIFVTEYKRTQQTAEPLAKLLGVQPVAVSAKDAAGLVEKVRAASGPVLIIGHSNTIPEILGKLGIDNPPKLADADYDNLFIVSGSEKKMLVRLHFR